MKAWILMIFLIPIKVFAQNIGKNSGKEHKDFFIGSNYSSDLCYRLLKNADGSEVNQSMINALNKEEMPKYGYTTGIVACYGFKKHWKLESGIQFSNKGYGANYGSSSDLRFPDQIDPTKGFTESTAEPGWKEVKKYKVKYNHLYLDIPLRVIFNYGEKKFRLITSLGVTTNILINSTETYVTKYSDGTKKRSSAKDQPYAFNKLNISPLYGVGGAYKINDRLNMALEGTLRFGMLKISNSPITAYLWNSGLNLTVYYKVR